LWISGSQNRYFNRCLLPTFLLPASFSSYQPPNQAQGFALDGLRGRGSSLPLGQGLAVFIWIEAGNHYLSPAQKERG